MFIQSILPLESILTFFVSRNTIISSLVILNLAKFITLTIFERVYALLQVKVARYEIAYRQPEHQRQKHSAIERHHSQH